MEWVVGTNDGRERTSTIRARKGASLNDEKKVCAGRRP